MQRLVYMEIACTKAVQLLLPPDMLDGWTWWITNKQVCRTRGLPSTPFDLLYNTPRSVACTLLRSTICTKKSILIVKTGSLDKEDSSEFTELDCATLIELVEMLAWVAEPDGGGPDTSPRRRAQSQHTR